MTQESMRTEETHSGARFQFDRLKVEAERVCYRVTVSWPEGSASVDVELHPNGAVKLGEPSAPLAPWMADNVSAFARVLAKNYDPQAGWPRLVHRWRAPK